MYPNLIILAEKAWSKQNDWSKNLSSLDIDEVRETINSSEIKDSSLLLSFLGQYIFFISIIIYYLTLIK